MHVTKFSSIVSQNKELAHDIFEIELNLENPKQIHFEAGQFVNIAIPSEERFIFRPYSMVSPPSESDRIRLCYKRVLGGLGSNYIAQLKLGDKVNFTGVFGQFILKKDSANDIIFIAGGVGIAPIYAMIQTLFEQVMTRSAKLYFSVKTEKDLFYYDELRELSNKHKNLKVITCITQQENPSYPHRKGRINSVLDITQKDGIEAYLCGSKEMVNDLKQLLIEKGLPKEVVFTEKFY